MDDDLLNRSHPIGRPDAALFLSRNVARENLRLTLIDHGRTGHVPRRRETAFGGILEVEDPVQTPIGRDLPLRTVREVRSDRPGVARPVTQVPS